MKLFIVVTFLSLSTLTLADSNYTSKTEILKELYQGSDKERAGSGSLPPDNGGNYGDLIYRARDSGDRILLSEVVINDVLSSSVIDMKWTVSIPGALISSVRVLNLGRERAYCVRIDVQGGDVQTILRLAPLYSPRVLIEVYGR